jgi:hypothetical protein
MHGSTSPSSFRDSWDRAEQMLRREHSIGGFCEMHERGEVSREEIFNLAYEHCYNVPEARSHLLSELANHGDEEIRLLAQKLSAFLATYT